MMRACRRPPPAETPTPRAAEPRDASRAPAALLLVLTAWSLLATQALLAPRIGRPAAVAALVRRGDGARDRHAPARARARAGARRRARRARRARRLRELPRLDPADRRASEPALGLRPVPPPPRPEDPLLLVAVLGLAPVFEELLYRERLLLALRARVGAGLAVAISSLLLRPAPPRALGRCSRPAASDSASAR